MDIQKFKVFTIKEAAIITGLPQTYFRKQIKKKKIRVLEGSVNPYYIPYTELERILNNKSIIS